MGYLNLLHLLIYKDFYSPLLFPDYFKFRFLMLLNCWNDTSCITFPIVSLYFIYSLVFQSCMMYVSCTP
jgi:hypothetical protein